MPVAHFRCLSEQRKAPPSVAVAELLPQEQYVHLATSIQASLWLVVALALVFVVLVLAATLAAVVVVAVVVVVAMVVLVAVAVSAAA